MQDGKIVNKITQEELLKQLSSGQNPEKRKSMVKTLKNLNKSSSVANRFVDTVHIANKDMMQMGEKRVELMPILRDA